MSPRNVFLLAALGALLLGFGAAAMLSRRENVETPQVAEFKLVDQQRRPVTREFLEGRWNLLFLGFTHCPDVCPTTLGMLKTVDARLRTAGAELRIVFLSADPERDTPQAMARYLREFDSAFIGLTGDKEEIERLCKSLGLGYLKNPGAKGEYSVDHSAALVLIDPQARAAAYFRPPFDPDRLAADLTRSIRSQR